MAIDKVYIQGNAYSWASTTFKVDGQVLNGVVGCKFSDKRERVKIYGAGKSHAPRGRTRGKYTAEASITLWKDSSEALRKYLGKQYGDREFTLTVQFFESALSVVSVELTRCIYGGTDEDVQESPDGLKDEIALDPMTISRNGRTLYDSTSGGSGLLASAVGAARGILGI